MSVDRHAKIEELFQRALDLPPRRRGAFLDEHCDGETTLRAEVDALCEHYAEAGDWFMQQAALNAVGRFH